MLSTCQVRRDPRHVRTQRGASLIEVMVAVVVLSIGMLSMAWQHAVALLRRLVPATARAADPVPFRSVLLRIHLDEVTGREASTQVSPRT